MGQVLPAATGAEDVQNGIDDLTHIDDARSAELIGGKNRFEDLPLSVSQVTRVGLAHGVRASGCLL